MARPRATPPTLPGEHGTSGGVTTRFPIANPVPPIAPPTIPGEHGTPGGSSDAAGAGKGPPFVVPTPDAPTKPPPTPTPLDWRAYLENWGFDTDIVNELDRIFRTYADSNAAGAAGLAYIRGTDWYKRTFPGIQEGMRLGVISNEQQYRAYTNQLNDIYSRYYGRTVTGSEVENALKAGHAPSWVDARFQGQAYIGANEQDIQYTLGAFGDTGRATPEELQALGDQQAGLDNLLGPEIQKRIAIAQKRLAGVFQGTLASPNFQTSRLGKLVAPSLGGGINPNDVAA